MMPPVRQTTIPPLPDLPMSGVPQKLDSMLVNILDIYIGQRQRKNHSDVDQMAKSLLENGQIHAITVRPTTDEDRAEGATQPWALVTGGRRLAGSILAGWNQIRAENLLDMSEFRRNAIELEENLQRRNLTWQEEIDAKQKLTALYRKENPTWADFQTAEVLGESKATVSKDLKLAEAIKLHPELAKASSKKAAHRLLDTKLSHARKVAQMVSFDASSIESRMLNCDAIDLLTSLPNNSVDLFLSDLPFGIDYFDMPSSDRKAGGGQSKFDDSHATALSLINRIMPLMLDKVKPDGWIILMASRELEVAIRNGVVVHKTQKRINHPDKAPNMAAMPWIWYRPNSRSNPIHPHLTAKSVYDHIYVINAGKGRLSRACDNVIMIDSTYDERIHAHQKPIPLGIELITRCTMPGAFVVDVTMGSGAFLAAAASVQRNFMGCDLNPDIVKLARDFVAPYSGGGLAPLQIQVATPQDGDTMQTEYPWDMPAVSASAIDDDLDPAEAYEPLDQDPEPDFDEDIDEEVEGLDEDDADEDDFDTIDDLDEDDDGN